MITPRHKLLAALGAAAALAATSASPVAAGDGTCSVALQVGFSHKGKFSGQTRDARCAGSFGDVLIDPRAPVSAKVRGLARPGASACVPNIAEGTLELQGRRLTALRGRSDVVVKTRWNADYFGTTLVAGAGTAEGRPVELLGSSQFLFSPWYGCSSGFPKIGRLELDLVLDDDR